MWRFIEGISNPTEKPKQSAAEKRKYYGDYDKNKRTRKYNSEWEKGRPWLKDSENGLICTVCTEFSDDKIQNFVSGCNSYKLDSVIKHEKSKQHEKNRLIAEAKSKSKSESEACKIIMNLNSDIVVKLDKMFRNCHALVISNRPFTDFVWLCKLDEAKGVHVGNTYRNKDYAKIFTQAIAEVEMKRVKNIVEQSQFISVIGDGSTDSSIKEQEMWFIRSSLNGQMSVKFLGVSTTDKANAENIVHGLKDLVSANLKLDWTCIAAKML